MSTPSTLGAQVLHLLWAEVPMAAGDLHGFQGAVPSIQESAAQTSTFGRNEDSSNEDSSNEDQAVIDWGSAMKTPAVIDWGSAMKIPTVDEVHVRVTDLIGSLVLSETMDAKTRCRTVKERIELLQGWPARTLKLTLLEQTAVLSDGQLLFELVSASDASISMSIVRVAADNPRTAQEWDAEALTSCHGVQGVKIFSWSDFVRHAGETHPGFILEETLLSEYEFLKIRDERGNGIGGL